MMKYVNFECRFITQKRYKNGLIIKLQNKVMDFGDFYKRFQQKITLPRNLQKLGHIVEFKIFNPF